VEHSTNIILAYVFGKRKDIVFKELKALLAPLKIKRFYTDDWGGELMNDILNPISTKWENVILKKLNVRI
ncbi:MAG: hypothetical protein GQ532_02830, partial [Methylomarinum sp.]|nr:hypothetical protein [Methylomarinum sp.]